jgi:signal transduction histidine kinase
MQPGMELTMMCGAESGEAWLPQWLARSEAGATGVASIDWSGTSLGAIEHWPQSLRTAFSLCSSLPIPACLVWGAARSQLFNEQYPGFCAGRCSPEPGQDFADCWRAQWSIIGPVFERAQAGESMLLELPVVPVQGIAARERTITLSFVPVRAERDEVGGVLMSAIGLSDTRELARVEKDFSLLDYALSHDLHAPLLDDHASQLPADASFFVQHFAQSTAQLNARIEGLIRFRKISTQTLIHRRVDVADIVRRWVAEPRKNAAGEPVHIEVGALPEAFGDYELLRQALTAVLSNAVKFVRHTQAPRIEIGSRREATRNVYFVTDNGAGFEMKYAGRLFGLFQRLHAEAQFEGAGIELALARRIVERHGGAVRAEARKDEGATFELALPASPEALGSLA